MSRCVICGKEYARKVTTSHLKSHKISEKKYNKLAVLLSEEMWEFYWTHPGMQKRWNDATASTPSDGRTYTFKTYMEGPGANLLD